MGVLLVDRRLLRVLLVDRRLLGVILVDRRLLGVLLVDRRLLLLRLILLLLLSSFCTVRRLVTGGNERCLSRSFCAGLVGLWLGAVAIKSVLHDIELPCVSMVLTAPSKLLSVLLVRGDGASRLAESSARRLLLLGVLLVDRRLLLLRLILRWLLLLLLRLFLLVILHFSSFCTVERLGSVSWTLCCSCSCCMGLEGLCLTGIGIKSLLYAISLFCVSVALGAPTNILLLVLLLRDDCDSFKREEQVRDVRDLRGDDILDLDCSCS
jgi:hypothetical protein